MLKKLAIALTAITFTLALTGCHVRSCELFQTGSQ